MRKIVTAIIAASLMTIWALAQEKKPEPDFAKVAAKPTAEEIAAREAALRLARHQFFRTAHQIGSSQGFRQRDRHWSAPLPDKGFTIIPLQLYAGNDYYVILGTDGDPDQIALSAFDPKQMLVKTAPDRGNGVIVLHITPTSSGRHYLRLHRKTEAKAPIHCVVGYVFR